MFYHTLKCTSSKKGEWGLSGGGGLFYNFFRFVEINIFGTRKLRFQILVQ